uniref:Putative secreted protein n=1 Tax=Anopheles triannulatus TaxID=58253 RepID=A0A2M4B631_9DIPT
MGTFALLVTLQLVVQRVVGVHKRQDCIADLLIGNFRCRMGHRFPERDRTKGQQQQQPAILSRHSVRASRRLDTMFRDEGELQGSQYWGTMKCRRTERALLLGFGVV